MCGFPLWSPENAQGRHDHRVAALIVNKKLNSLCETKPYVLRNPLYVY